MLYSTADAVAFLTERGYDAKGRTVKDYLAFSPADWESCHDHMQWAFPNHQTSAFNPDAPIVRKDVMDAMPKDQMTFVRLNMVKLFGCYIKSLGIVLENTEFKLNTLSPYWMQERDHNFLRITRVIYALRLAGMDTVAQKFGAFVLKLASRYPYAINKTTIGYWKAALNDTL